MNGRLPDSCRACDRPITGEEWDWRHTVSDTEAIDHLLDSGDYHETCCPLCGATAEVAS